MKLARDFRQQAREALSGNWFIAVIAAFIASLLGGLSDTGVSFRFNFNVTSSGTPDDNTGVINSFFTEEVLAIILAAFAVIAVIVIVIGIIHLIIGSVVSIGYAKFNLDILDGNEPELGTMFTYFSEWGKAIAASILRALYTFLWSCLFVIPGIMAAYSYRMTPFIMAENPYLSAREAIKKSKEIMYGNRWRLFCLEFSFIGWALITIITLGIASLWVCPYQQAALAAFYRDITRVEN